MSQEPASPACPTCGSALGATGSKLRCPACGESFSLLYRQPCPGCGLIVSGSSPAARCPDCDETLPPASASWQYTAQKERCPACQHKLTLCEAGTRQCAHCGFTRSFNRSSKRWEETLRPLLCACGQIITSQHSDTECPACGQQFRLNPARGQWEEIPTYTEFTCPTCGQRHNIPLRAQQTNCNRCGLHYSVRDIQNRPTWACDTEAGTCPICDSPLERTPDGSRSTCPSCKYIYAYDKADDSWKHIYRQLHCFCGTLLTQSARHTRCPGCNRHYRFNKAAGKWQEFAPKTTPRTHTAPPHNAKSGKREPRTPKVTRRPDAPPLKRSPAPATRKKTPKRPCPSRRQAAPRTTPSSSSPG